MKKHWLRAPVIIALGILGISFLLWYFRDLFSMAVRTVVISLLLAAFLTPLMRLYQKLHLPEKYAILCSILTLLALLISVLFAGLPRVMQEVTALGHMELPDAFPRLEEKAIRFLSRFVEADRAGEMWRELLNRIGILLNDRLPGLVSAFLSGLQRLWGNLPALLLSPVAAYYFLRDRRSITRRFLSLFSIRHEAKIRKLVIELWQAVEGFFKGQLTVAFFVGLLSVVCFLLVGLPFALLLGLLSGILDLIPYFGPFIGAVPVLLVTLIYAPQKFILVLLILVLIQQAENALISPRVLSDATGLHPLMVMLSTLIGARAGGILGMILAVPVLSVGLKITGFAADLILRGDGG